MLTDVNKEISLQGQGHGLGHKGQGLVAATQ